MLRFGLLSSLPLLLPLLLLLLLLLLQGRASRPSWLSIALLVRQWLRRLMKRLGLDDELVVSANRCHRRDSLARLAFSDHHVHRLHAADAELVADLSGKLGPLGTTIDLQLMSLLLRVRLAREEDPSLVLALAWLHHHHFQHVPVGQVRQLGIGVERFLGRTVVAAAAVATSCFVGPKQVEELPLLETQLMSHRLAQRGHVRRPRR